MCLRFLWPVINIFKLDTADQTGPGVKHVVGSLIILFNSLHCLLSATQIIYFAFLFHSPLCFGFARRTRVRIVSEPVRRDIRPLCFSFYVPAINGVTFNSMIILFAVECADVLFLDGILLCFVDNMFGAGKSNLCFSAFN